MRIDEISQNDPACPKEVPNANHKDECNLPPGTPNCVYPQDGGKCPRQYFCDCPELHCPGKKTWYFHRKCKDGVGNCRFDGNDPECPKEEPQSNLRNQCFVSKSLRCVYAKEGAKCPPRIYLCHTNHQDEKRFWHYQQEDRGCKENDKNQPGCPKDEPKPDGTTECHATSIPSGGCVYPKEGAKCPPNEYFCTTELHDSTPPGKKIWHYRNKDRDCKEEGPLPGNDENHPDCPKEEPKANGVDECHLRDLPGSCVYPKKGEKCPPNKYFCHTDNKWWYQNDDKGCQENT